MNFTMFDTNMYTRGVIPVSELAMSKLEYWPTKQSTIKITNPMLLIFMFTVGDILIFYPKMSEKPVFEMFKFSEFFTFSNLYIILYPCKNLFEYDKDFGQTRAKFAMGLNPCVSPLIR